MARREWLCRSSGCGRGESAAKRLVQGEVDEAALEDEGVLGGMAPFEAAEVGEPEGVSPPCCRRRVGGRRRPACLAVDCAARACGMRGSEG